MAGEGAPTSAECKNLYVKTLLLLGLGLGDCDPPERLKYHNNDVNTNMRHLKCPTEHTVLSKVTLQILSLCVV